eukprot:TRINITY_DN213_c0_g2_i1.p1 TRINITY_DN213_c0_g2~~TRINITY_DN213_c0_g2_i1.p1  ORF type:complete len:202 (+),score=53.93 TRINITY_DN213_c0_g2_i1:184-789(+)
MHKLVMNYLVIEGYKECAEQFQAESGVPPGVDLDAIHDRMAIRTAVQRGDISDAMEKVNDLDPEILDHNGSLFFHLQQQKFIELVRAGRVDEALDFAQDELAARGEEQPRFLEELERTMTLLAFEDAGKSPLAELMDIGQRQKTASELNAAILSAQSQEKDPKLPTILKLLLWKQQQLADKGVAFPRITNLASAEFDATSG